MVVHGEKKDEEMVVLVNEVLHDVKVLVDGEGFVRHPCCPGGGMGSDESGVGVRSENKKMWGGSEIRVNKWSAVLRVRG